MTRQRSKRRPPFRSWHAWALLLLIAAALAFCENVGRDTSSASAATFSCTVARVTDGDTLRCADGTRVRLSAIAARESNGTCSPGHPCPSATAAAAKQALERLASGKRLTCEATGRSYDRVTAWCEDADGTQLNCAMVEGGYAAKWARYDPTGRLCN